jgi:hypothetical protein
MRLRFSPTVFMLAYCIVYIAALATDLPAFRYYPLHGQFNWGPGKVTGLGPAMAWYGIVLEAAVAGGVLGFVVPGGWVTRALRNFLWLVPLAAMLACAYLMKKFFV